MKKLYLALVCLGFFAWLGTYQPKAQNSTGVGDNVQAVVQNRSTLNASVGIVTSGTFQLLLTSITSGQAINARGNLPNRQEMTIQNNSSGVTCYLWFGPAAPVSISATYALPAFAVYHRDWPFTPADAVWGTCNGGATTSSTLYVDTE